MADETKNRSIDDNIGKGDDLASRVEHGSDFGKKDDSNYQGNRNDKPYDKGTGMGGDINRDVNRDMDKNKPGYGNEKKDDYK